MNIYRGNLGEISNKADWISPVIHFVDTDDNSEIDLTQATAIYFEIKDPTTKCILVEADLSNGKIALVEDGFQVSLTPSDLSRLCAGQYLASLSFTMGGLKHDPVLANITVLEGAG